MKERKETSPPPTLSWEALADKLLVLVDQLSKGERLRSAANRAGLSDEQVRSLVVETRRLLRSLLHQAKKTRSKRVVAYSDGASRGNPGEAACAAVLESHSGRELLSRTKLLGLATNNVAEYQGVILALESALEVGAEEVVLKLDSELVGKQLSGRFKVKNDKLKPLFARAKELLSQFASARIELIPREKNDRADALANAALDSDR